MAFGPKVIDDKRKQKISEQVRKFEDKIDQAICSTLDLKLGLTVYLPETPLAEVIDILTEKYKNAGWRTVKFDSGYDYRESWSEVKLSI